jgi:hypothetical protein
VQDEGAAKAVAGLSQMWPETAEAAYTEVRPCTPVQLGGLADESFSGVTVLRAADLARLRPGMTSQEVAELITAAAQV